MKNIIITPFTKDLKRTHQVGTLRHEHNGQTVVLMGWVSVLRDHGGVRFVDLRDHTGIVQIVFSPDKSEDNHAIAHSLKAEDVIAVIGKVQLRSPETKNPKMKTGEVEVWCTNVYVLNRSYIIPFQIEDEINVNEDTRLLYRHLDLRRPVMQDNIRNRHKLTRTIRRTLDDLGFVDIETPVLTRSTPEGARDYLVPSRIYPGCFFALPQSPQLFKQLLMISGFDRYYQIVKCFRDEDLRADRQPEFTQLDMEMAFIHEEDIFEICEKMFVNLFGAMGFQVPERPFPRLTYNEAVSCYGNDRPDTRFEMKLFECTDLVGESEFQVFKSVANLGGAVIGMPIPGGGAMSRKEIDDLIAQSQQIGAKGLAYFKVTDDAKLKSNIDKFFSPFILSSIYERSLAKPGDLIIFIADKLAVARKILSALRLDIAHKCGIIDDNKNNLVWVVDFPLFDYDAALKRYVSMHHPFTSPRPEDLDKLESNTLDVKARAYDLVWNGIEVGGGSIRIHQTDVQSRIFRLLNISEREAEEKFSFLLDGLKSGAPPHGGIAFGIDRICMLFFKTLSIRDVIAFPKTQRSQCLLTHAPASVDERQLKELSLKIISP